MSQQQFRSAERMNRSSFEDIRTMKIPEVRLNQAHMGQQIKSTRRLTEAQRRRTPIVWRSKYKPSEGAAEDFVVLPHGTASSMIPRWLIRMEGLTPTKPLGIEVASDIVLGLMRSVESRPDLNFDLFGGYDKGVSRRHAMIRPS